MKRGEMDPNEAIEDWQWPSVKPPLDFTGKGLEIIGDPNGKSGGELHFRDGKCRCMNCASPPVLTTDDAKKRIPTLAEQIAQFILSRNHRLSHPPANHDDPGEQRREARGLNDAFRYAEKIAGQLLNGQFLPFAQKVERAAGAIKKEKQIKNSGRSKWDGYRDALFGVVWQCNHPNEVTVSAVVDYLTSDSDFCRAYGITDSMKEPREVRKGMKEIGFDWISSGRGKGRPNGRKSAK